MIVRCTKQHQIELIDYLEQEVVFNTFMIADINNYGFNFEHQTIFMQRNESGNITNVYLLFFNNLIIAGQKETLEFAFIKKIMTQAITMVMGKDSLIQELANELSLTAYYHQTNFYTLKTNNKLKKIRPAIQLATLEDVSDVHLFMQSIPEFSHMYRDQAMISNRIKAHDGFHLIIRKDEQIIAHGNSAAQSRLTAMIGGVAVKNSERQQGLAQEMVSAVAEKIIAHNRTPCIFNNYPEERSLLVKLGFELFGYWGTIEIN